MNRFVTVCSFLMGGLLLALCWLYPGSIITWFTGAEQPFLLMKIGIAVSLVVLLAAEAYADMASIRWVAGLVAFGLAYGAWRLVVEHPVYVLDVLFMLSAAVCFGMVALQSANETRYLPAGPKQVTAAHDTLPVLARLRRQLSHRRPDGRFRYLSDIKDDSHNLTVNVPRS